MLCFERRELDHFGILPIRGSTCLLSTIQEIMYKVPEIKRIVSANAIGCSLRSAECQRIVAAKCEQKSAEHHEVLLLK
jgi:hypothetical protein